MATMPLEARTCALPLYSLSLLEDPGGRHVSSWDEKPALWWEGGKEGMRVSV